MAKAGNQRKPHKPESNRIEKKSISESTRSDSACNSERSRKGNAGDGTSSTGPRKK